MGGNLNYLSARSCYHWGGDDLGSLLNGSFDSFRDGLHCSLDGLRRASFHSIVLDALQVDLLAKLFLVQSLLSLLRLL